MKKEIDKRDSVKVVTDNRFLTANGLERLRLKERKLLYLAISQVKMKDSDFYEYSVSVKDFAEMMDVAPTNVYTEADQITDNLLRCILKCEKSDSGKKSMKKYTIFSTCEYAEGGGNISFKLNPDMTDLLIKLGRSFTQPLLNDFMRMRSTYSMEIWHLFQREMHSKKPGVTGEIKFYLSLDEIRQVTGTENTFERLSDIKRYVLDKAIREIIDLCLVDIEYENVKRGRTVTGFEFTAKGVAHVDINSIPFEVRSRVEKRAEELKL